LGGDRCLRIALSFTLALRQASWRALYGLQGEDQLCVDERGAPAGVRRGRWFCYRGVIIWRRRLLFGGHMDPSGRFNFWRMLLHTRAVTPPRVPPNHWSRAVILWRPGRWLLLLMMVLAAALAVRLSVNNQPTLSAAIGPPSPVAPTSWAPTLPWWGLPTGKPGQLAAMRTSSKIL